MANQVVSILSQSSPPTASRARNCPEFFNALDSDAAFSSVQRFTANMTVTKSQKTRSRSTIPIGLPQPIYCHPANKDHLIPVNNRQWLGRIAGLEPELAKRSASFLRFEIL